MEKKKKSNKKGYFLFVIIYLLIGVLLYFGIKKYYIPTYENYDENSRHIADAVEIDDDTSLLYSLSYNKKSYALIYGTFKCSDPVKDVFFGNIYSYIEEVTIDESTDPETILDNKVRSSPEFSIFGVNVNGLNFDFEESVLHKSIRAIKKKNIRYDYYIKPGEYTGTMLVKINNDESVNYIQFYKYKTIKSLKEENMNKTYLIENAFVVLWLVLLFMILISFDPDGEKFDEIKF